jgi:hypothetical protein
MCTMTGPTAPPRRLPADRNAGKDSGDPVTYETLLERAHGDGLSRIDTHILQIPCAANGNVAIVHASVTTGRGSFEGIGDASPGNVNRSVAPHLIRQAETRAKARALRDATNAGTIPLDELAAGGDTPALRPVRETPPEPDAEPPVRSARTSRGATPEQLAEIDALSGRLGFLAPMHPLSPQEAATHIASLKARLAGAERTAGLIPGAAADPAPPEAPAESASN